MNKALKAAKRVLPVFRQTIDGWATGVTEGSIDAEVKVTCKKGCHHCCYNAVNATLAEGAAIAAHLLESKTFEKYRPQLEVTSKLADECGDSDAGLFKYMGTKTPCAFLKDGECSIYDLRPAACRTYFVVSPAEDCAPEKNGKEVAQVDPSPAMSIFFTRLAEETKGPIPLLVGPFPSVVLAGKELVERSPSAFKRWAVKSPLFTANQEVQHPPSVLVQDPPV